MHGPAVNAQASHAEKNSPGDSLCFLYYSWALYTWKGGHQRLENRVFFRKVVLILEPQGTSYFARHRYAGDPPLSKFTDGPNSRKY